MRILLSIIAGIAIATAGIAFAIFTRLSEPDDMLFELFAFFQVVILGAVSAEFFGDFALQLNKVSQPPSKKRRPRARRSS